MSTYISEHTPMNRPFVTRKFYLRRTSMQLEVAFYKPVRRRSAYTCRYEIRKGKEVIWESSATGVDDLEAIRRAMGSALEAFEVRFPKLRAKIPDIQLDDLRVGET